MSAEQIPDTLKVQCSCGWRGTTEDLEDKTCPICGEAFEAYPSYPFEAMRFVTKEQADLAAVRILQSGTTLTYIPKENVGGNYD